jgi:hypothetical protein
MVKGLESKRAPAMNRVRPRFIGHWSRALRAELAMEASFSAKLSLMFSNTSCASIACTGVGIRIEGALFEPWDLSLRG